MIENILLHNNLGTPFNSVPFSKITIENFKEAFDVNIKEAKTEIEFIKNIKAKATFENTIVALEQSGEKLGLTSSVFFNLNSAETNDDMQALAMEVSPNLSAFSTGILFDEKLFARVKEAYDNTDQSSLNNEEIRLLDITYKNFKRNGALLPKEQKERLAEIAQEASVLSLQFGENVLKDTNSFELLITKEADLSGLPKGVIDTAFEEAKIKGKKGWLFTLQYPSYIPFMTYADNRSLRKEMFMAFGTRAFKDNEQNNESIITKIVNLKTEKAKILGYKHYADYVLEERMAKSVDKVYNLLNDLLEASIEPALNDWNEVLNYAKKTDSIDDFNRWDFGYYSEKLKNEKFSINDEMLKPYFKLENCVNGVFETASKLYDLTFHKRNDIDTYHKDVDVYEVLDADENLVSLFYADFFPREGKRAGAWMTSFRGQYVKDNLDHRPHVSIVCNFTKPTKDTPSLLTFNELTTLFHEFGHALHGMLAKGNFSSMSGTSVLWDFVELPSQIFENWCYEKECLDFFAKHYQTGNEIPQEYIDKIKASANFLSGYQSARQISLGMLDLAWHTQEKSFSGNVEEFENMAMSKALIADVVKGTNTSSSFSHIFQGGYSAGYYSYKWAEVLDADAYESFVENGVFNKDVANSFRKNILERGNSKHPLDLYVAFKGREPKVEALLKRSGLK